MTRIIKQIFIVISIIQASSVSAQIYKLTGKVGNQYPIVIEMTKHDSGYCTGRYAYNSTLNKQGDNPCSWLEIYPSHDNPNYEWDTRDCNLTPQEHWFNVRFNGRTLTARMKNSKGKYYDIAANVVSSRPGPDDFAEHFRRHIGDYPSEFAMFFDPSVQERFENLMGINNFNYLASIFQTQYPIEYRSGMYWSGGFCAHQCCDPAAIWAYDTRNKSFYIWIRKDGKDYWWSESGNIPYEFRELVSATF